jgi:transcriptional regulator with XRE-family HTH domain
LVNFLDFGRFAQKRRCTFVFYDNFLELCNSVGEKPSAVALKLGISKATVSNWKRRKNGATDATALKIANYFGITVDELKNGIKKQPSIPKDEELNKNDAMWELREAVLRSCPDLSLQQVSNIMNYIEFQVMQNEKDD